MDVRCDRCQTEYELDDAIVTDAGAAVQCTTCSHTFFVRRGGNTPASSVFAPAPPELTAPDVPEWTLSTEDGKIHRFRDLNTLQKWVVERKVTRADRVSRASGPWTLLGDMPELAPFFSVVEQADRALATSIPNAQPRSPSAPLPGVTPPALGLTFAAPAAEGYRRVAEDGPTVPDRRLVAEAASAMARAGSDTPANDSRLGAVASGQDARASNAQGRPQGKGTPAPLPKSPSGPLGNAPGLLRGSESGGAAASSIPAPGLRPPARTEIVFAPAALADPGDTDSEFLRPSHKGRNAFLALLGVAAASGGFWWWIEQSHEPAANTSASVPASATAVAAEKVVTKSPLVVGTSPTSTGTHVETATEEALRRRGDDASAPPTATGDAVGKSNDQKLGGTETEPAARPNAATVSQPPVPGGKAGLPKAPGSIAANATAHPGSKRTEGSGKAVDNRSGGGAYEKLVAEADRTLERGGAVKADKLYTQALTLRPDGVAALTGSAYVLLDRQRHFKAIEVFRRALAVDPTYGPALFGIGESYRARGDNAQALAAYRQYLALSPSGVDAPAARHQIKELESVVAHPGRAPMSDDDSN